MKALAACLPSGDESMGIVGSNKRMQVVLQSTALFLKSLREACDNEEHFKELWDVSQIEAHVAYISEEYEKVNIISRAIKLIGSESLYSSSGGNKKKGKKSKGKKRKQSVEEQEQDEAEQEELGSKSSKKKSSAKKKKRKTSK